MPLVIYICLGISIVSIEVRRYLKRQPIDALGFFNVVYFVLFVLVPINVVFCGEDVVRQKYAFETYGSGDVSTAVSVALSYLLFYLGYAAGSLRRQRQSPSQNRSRPRIVFPVEGSNHVAKLIFWIGVCLTFLYVMQVGGIWQVISSASDIRSGETPIESKYIFYRQFSGFSADAFVLAFAVLLKRRLDKTRITAGDKIFLCCAFVFFVYYALSTGGRRPFIYAIMLCLLLLSSTGVKARKIVAAAAVAVFLLAGLGAFVGPVVASGDSAAIFDVLDLDRGDWQTLGKITYDTASQGLADSYIHFVAAQKASLWQFGFLKDIANLPTDFFPSRVFGFVRTRNFLGETSEFILGHPLEEEMSGEEPLGLHGYLLVNFGYTGMFGIFLILGALYRWIHDRAKPTDDKDPVGWLIYWWLVLGFFVYFREGILLFVIKLQLTWWITAWLLVRSRRMNEFRLAMGARKSCARNAI